MSSYVIFVNPYCVFSISRVTDNTVLNRFCSVTSSECLQYLVLANTKNYENDIILQLDPVSAALV
ncbi:hypothetical protein GEMRC1_013593 [Eukaryota sp. GEM-RC1]